MSRHRSGARVLAPWNTFQLAYRSPGSRGHLHKLPSFFRFRCRGVRNQHCNPLPADLQGSWHRGFCRISCLSRGIKPGLGFPVWPLTGSRRLSALWGESPGVVVPVFPARAPRFLVAGSRVRLVGGCHSGRAQGGIGGCPRDQIQAGKRRTKCYDVGPAARAAPLGSGAPGAAIPTPLLGSRGCARSWSCRLSESPCFLPCSPISGRVPSQ